ncbi:MAG TPA: trehalase family glycosidase [Acetobacteraceae bacterium]|nr:trehalase family glycosidase [Acetobacteraceae bacterium]
MSMAEQARATLRANDRGGYSVPTARLYPFQWNWDSAFVAMGWATFDEDRAWQEIHWLLKGQWDDGMIPHIVFHAPSDDYFPGPAVWGVMHAPPTSGITQPPVLAAAVRHLWDHARDRAAAEANAASVYPSLLCNHRWWQAARDPQRHGLVATLHPWETGMDNSPAWDGPLARVPTETVSPIRRRDTMLVDAAMRPRGEEYQRFIHLVDLFRDAGWEPARMLSVSPFRVADVGTNAILLRAEKDLLALARRFGSVPQQAEIETRIERISAALERLWQEEAGLYVSLDLVTHALCPVGTSAGFLPLFAWHGQARAARLAATLAAWGGRATRLVPSADPGFAGFEPKRYWRGPVWAVVNWMIADGFATVGNAGTASRIRTDTIALIETAGLSEYFEPISGEGIGGADFSWTAAIYLMWCGGGS